MKKIKKYFVIWEDSYTHEPGWKENVDFKEDDPQSPLACTIGFLVDESKRFMTFSQSMDFGSHSNNAISIPKSAILKTIEIRTNIYKHLKEVIDELTKNENS